MSADLYQMFHETARGRPEHPAIIGPDGVAITYGRLDQLVQEMAESLRRAGLRGGECVGLHCPGGSRYIALNYAVWRCGGCVVPIATELAPDEKQQICRQIALDYVIAEGGTAAFTNPFRRGDDATVLENVSLTPVRSPRQRRRTSIASTPPSFVSLRALRPVPRA